jgi:hypothetical protein
VQQPDAYPRDEDRALLPLSQFFQEDPPEVEVARVAATRRPSDRAILDRSRGLAIRAVWTLDLQRTRLQSWDGLEGDFLFQLWSDLEFYILTLSHLRQAAELARRVDQVKRRMKAAIRDFDDAIPHLTAMLNVIEHIDEYAADIRMRNHSHVRRLRLQIGTWDGTTFWLLGSELNVDTAFHEARRLVLRVHDLTNSYRSP